MSLKIIDVAGLKKSGKTTVIENIVSELKSRGYKIGTVKKIHIPGFTIDQEGKDTYRHKQAGAEFVISLAPEEVALIRELHNQRSLAEIMDLIPPDTDFLVCEELNETRDDVLYIVTLKTLDSLDETLNVRNVGKKIIAVSGVVSNSEDDQITNDKHPIINSTTTNGKKRLVDLILDAI
jgi:molybdopterin-guanine dinucleotide biosynthesis protein B